MHWGLVSITLSLSKSNIRNWCFHRRRHQTVVSSFSFLFVFFFVFVSFVMLLSLPLRLLIRYHFSFFCLLFSYCFFSLFCPFSFRFFFPFVFSSRYRICHSPFPLLLFYQCQYCLLNRVLSCLVMIIYNEILLIS